MEKEKKVIDNGIDKDVIETMIKNDPDILAALADDKLTKRLILNCFCEFLSEIKKLRQSCDDFMQTISVCSADKLTGFFKEVATNVDDEKTRIALKEEMSKSHKKSRKSQKNTKKDENIVDFSTKKVK